MSNKHLFVQSAAVTLRSVIKTVIISLSLSIHLHFTLISLNVRNNKYTKCISGELGVGPQMFLTRLVGLLLDYCVTVALLRCRGIFTTIFCFATIAAATASSTSSFTSSFTKYNTL